MPHLICSDEQPHDEAEELLPWYATGQLDPEQRALVEQHLLTCAHCEQQLALERRLIGQFREMAPEVESGWARLRARIDAPAPIRPTRPGPFAEFWAFLSRPAVAGFAAAQLAFVIVAGGTLVSLSRPDYHALGSAPAPAAANVIVIFRADATEGDVRDVLKAAGASIVGGPTPANAYLLHVALGQRQLALAKLQSDDNVQMAEPIDGAGS
jgi:anti-sigma factor RsiW